MQSEAPRIEGSDDPRPDIWSFIADLWGDFHLSPTSYTLRTYPRQWIFIWRIFFSLLSHSLAYTGWNMTLAEECLEHYIGLIEKMRDPENLTSGLELSAKETKTVELAVDEVRDKGFAVVEGF